MAFAIVVHLLADSLGEPFDVIITPIFFVGLFTAAFLKYPVLGVRRTRVGISIFAVVAIAGTWWLREYVGHSREVLVVGAAGALLFVCLVHDLQKILARNSRRRF
ncbi:hypothetical protein [Phytomonospora endophytica]|uniref:hypothetical protein n=1 Tax=Phytomonospora endophytica TaxID=714109 RepID=UPI001C851461|nr:hypothetical protein [Phytomonospora endophytica]